jgi:DNA uptake protein ComE-like DNA-binding protein
MRVLRCLLALAVLATASAPSASADLQTGMPHAATGLLDINTATLAQLTALPGMGDAYARRVIAARPYTAKNQLVTRGVLPQAAYERIKDRIVAHRH